ncbi:hypothetical protein [Hungatella effluvii]|uniref:hypothetical protein n=1 Tax=Hungatella effluvii TaxID=1096246 RepID=UPI0022E18464|nr:hypothetical protein [Hungatella effluvii]
MRLCSAEATTAYTETRNPLFAGCHLRSRSSPILLEFIGRVFRDDRIYLCQKTGGEPFKNIYNWCSAGTHFMADSLEELCSLDWNITPEFPAVSFSDTASVEDPRLRSWFKARGAKAPFLFCLGDPGKLITIIGMEDCPPPETLEEMRYSLLMVSEILNLFRNYIYFISTAGISRTPLLFNLHL